MKPDLKLITELAIMPALEWMPARLTSPQALVMLLAIGLQESGFQTRVQLGNGPARGWWQFEQGGGVAGVLGNSLTRPRALDLCTRCFVKAEPEPVWKALEHNDILAAGLARLLLYADPKPLPALDDPGAAWECYVRCWRPGKPRPTDWPENYAAALAEVNS